MITEKECSENMIVYDRYGKKHHIIKYNYPITKDFLECVNPSKYEEIPSHCGENILILYFDMEVKHCRRVVLSDNDYFDIISKNQLSEINLVNNYYITAPTKEEISNNILEDKDKIISRCYNNLKDLMADQLYNLDSYLFDYEEMLIDENKMTDEIFSEIKDISKVVNDIRERIMNLPN